MDHHGRLLYLIFSGYTWFGVSRFYTSIPLPARFRRRYSHHLYGIQALPSISSYLHRRALSNCTLAT
jgi:hypothetical protein